MTVKDIPDMGRSTPTPKPTLTTTSSSSASNSHTLSKKPHNLTIHLSAQQQQQQNGNHNNNYQHNSFQHQTTTTAATSSTSAYDTNYDSDTIKRSPQNRSGGGNNNNHVAINAIAAAKSTSPMTTTSETRNNLAAAAGGDHLSFYETSSNATTITPTPSESGRDTPQPHQHQRDSSSSTRDLYQNVQTLQQHHHHAYLPHPNHHRPASTTPSTTNNTFAMDSLNASPQSHSFVFAKQSQSAVALTDVDHHHTNTTAAVDSHETRSSIPYHAREDSRPFTYGNPTGVQLHPGTTAAAGATSPQSSQDPTGQQPQQNGTGMLKMQSGLSSPSLVRRTLAHPIQTTHTSSSSSTLPRKVRNDFEEMLLQRREKVMSDKYSIGDHQTNGQSPPLSNNNNSGQYVREVKWSNDNGPTTTTTTISNTNNNNNGYQYEPLRRANTMDGGFGRSHSTDG